MKLKPSQILSLHKSGKKKFKRSTLIKAASNLGKAGGLKGGPRRAEVLTLDETQTIAIHAANMRWGNPCNCVYCMMNKIISLHS